MRKTSLYNSRKARPISVYSCGSQPRWIHLLSNTLPKAQGTWQKRDQKDYQESENQGVCFEMVSPSNIRSYIYKVSPTWLCRCDLNKDDISKPARLDEGKPMRLQLHKELQETEYSCELNRQSSRRKNIPRVSLVPNGQPWKYVYK